MPGLLLHLSFGKKIYEKIGEKYKLDKSDFLSGCLIPDLTVDKKDSHYRVPASITKYFVPKMDTVKNELFDLNDSLKLGLYCHLYLDYHFFEHYIFKKYKWENGFVTIPFSGVTMSEDSFFERGKGIYGAYGELNHLLIKDEIITNRDLDIIPELLPNTNIEVFDKRREKSWRAELNEYLSSENEYSGEILDYKQVVSLLDELTDLFINNI
ncbi:MAG: zinc dependent phospholipase C family protein [Clostridia bacterium]|nr:zinc dependent phospholipase C family protein [Clostridia bacterium]